MLYVTLYVNKNGFIETIHINPVECKKEELIRIVNSYVNLVRVAIEFIIGVKSFFSYNLSDVKNIEYIDFFKGYSV